MGWDAMCLWNIEGGRVLGLMSLDAGVIACVGICPRKIDRE